MPVRLSLSVDEMVTVAAPLTSLAVTLTVLSEKSAVSRPLPPSSVSLPPPPLKVSLPSLPVNRLAALPPVKRSAPLAPVAYSMLVRVSVSLPILAVPLPLLSSVTTTAELP